jgi:transcriptional regulator with XRE-family HTH domain
MYAAGMGTEYQERVGAALSAVRVYLQLSQEDVARAGATSVSTISNYEHGRVSPQAETLVRIARALDVPMELLLDPPDRDEVLIALAVHRGRRRAGPARD